MRKTIILALAAAFLIAPSDAARKRSRRPKKSESRKAAAQKQNTDVIILKNGKKIRGKIVIYFPQDYLTINTARGQFTFAWSKIAKIVQEHQLGRKGEELDTVKMANGKSVKGIVVEKVKGNKVVVLTKTGRRTIKWGQMHKQARDSIEIVQDKVYLKGGEVKQGQVMKQTPKKYIRLKTATGVETVPWHMVKKVEYDKKTRALLEDIITLKNGDLLMGKIIKQQKGKYIRLKSETGEEKVAWNEIKKIEPAKERPIDFTYERKQRGLGLSYSSLDRASMLKIRKWKQQGGWLKGYGFGGSFIYMSAGDLKGVGYGVTLELPFLYLTQPDKQRKRSRFAFMGSIGGAMQQIRLVTKSTRTTGSTTGTSGFSGSTTGGSSSGTTTQYEQRQFQLNLNLNLKLGVLIDLSKFSLGISYKPAYQKQTLKQKSTDDDESTTTNESKFKPVGFEFDLLFSSVNKNLDRFITKPIFKISFFILPIPGAFSVNAGLVIQRYY